MSRVLALDLEPRTALPDFQAPRWLPVETECVLVKSWRDGIPESPEGFTHIILSGSTCSITRDYPIVEPCEHLIREAAKMRIPILGICYGHQMIVRALLGVSHVRRAQVTEMGWMNVSWGEAGSDWFDGLPNPFRVFMGHFDEVHDLPDDWQITARTSDCAVQGFVNPKLRLLGTQFHPEMDLAVGNRCFIADTVPLEKLGFNISEIVRAGSEDGSGKVIFPRFVNYRWPE
ncbi:MAG: gamma-glutamyl-gamma-aminobutyrate hydrolase family protein [Candidatus Brocadiia bacterium]